MIRSRSLLVTAGVLIATAVAATPAAAESHRLEGKIKGDADGAVAMKIVMGAGKPREARRLRFADLDYSCESGASGERTFTAKNVETREQDGKDGHEGFALDVFAGGVEWTLSGLVDDSGERVRGLVFLSFTDDVDGFCSSKPGGSRYSAREK